MCKKNLYIKILCKYLPSNVFFTLYESSHRISIGSVIIIITHTVYTHTKAIINWSTKKKRAIYRTSTTSHQLTRLHVIHGIFCLAWVLEPQKYNKYYRWIEICCLSSLTFTLNQVCTFLAMPLCVFLCVRCVINVRKQRKCRRSCAYVTSGVFVRLFLLLQLLLSVSHNPSYILMCKQ